MSEAPGGRRDDLLQLTPQALAQLANLGLVKRARRELDEGPAPALELDEQGTLNASFADGARARLVRGKALRDCPCSCGATTVCRHRVAAILAYQRVSTGPVAPARSAPWSPADIDETQLLTLLGRGTLERAAQLCRRGLLVEVLQGTFAGDSLPQAQLATSTVRFLVAGDPGYARCDCRARSACEHVALAVWAFRAARERDPRAPSMTVELGELAGGGNPHRSAALEAARQVADLVLLEGASRLPEAVSTRFALAREALRRAGAAWPLGALEDLEELLQAYGRRSTRYAPGRLADTLLDLVARSRAGAGGGTLPAAAILGCDEAPEVALDQLRLLSLGARIIADGDEREVEVLLADPASAQVMVLRRHYTPQPGSGQDGAALGRRQGLAGSAIAQVATGQLVSNAAVRRPNRLISFATGPLRKTSVLPGGAGLQSVPATLIVDDVAAFQAQLAARPPRMLRPRLLADSVRVFRVSEVVELAYDPGEQALAALCLDATGEPFELQARHRSVAPGALPALALVLAGSGKVEAVVGEARRHGARLVVEPLSVWSDRPVVLDFEEVTPEGTQALASLRTGLLRARPGRADLAGVAPGLRAASPRPTPLGLGGPDDRLGEALASARDLLAEAAHVGLRATGPAWSERLRGARAELTGLGLEHAGHDLESLEHTLLAARATGAELDEAAAAAAWATASLRLELLAYQT